MMAQASPVVSFRDRFQRRPVPAARAAAHILFMRGAGGEAEDWLKAVARDRDRAAFQALFGHFAPRVKAYLMRLGAPGPQAEDLAQEAMLSLWRKAHLFDPAKASAGTWVFTIARNLRIDAIRREKRPELDPADPMLAPDAGPGAEEGLAAAEQEVRLRAALKTLPPDQIRVVELSFFADKPHSQIAAELAIPLGTVKSRLRLAMLRLRAVMGEMP
jgi:RNA polymerase sigma-70 factor (ECF subfamily)